MKEMKEILETQKDYYREKFKDAVEEERQGNKDTKEILEITVGVVQEPIQQMENGKASKID